jgi:SAM-dependent methyltransferase
MVLRFSEHYSKKFLGGCIVVNYYDVYREHKGKVSDKWIHYFSIYDQLLEKFLTKETPINLLEIGVQNGGSLEIWEKYLPQGSQIYGIDINEKCANLTFSNNIHFYLGNAADNDFMNTTFKGIDFDVVLDDGSHICKEVIETFVNMFPKVKNGGVYIAEDLHTSYWKGYGGGLLRKGTSIEFFKKLIDTTNYDYFAKGRRNKYLYGNTLAFAKKYAPSIARISFYDSICAVDKFYQPKQEPFEAVYTGEKDGVSSFSNSTRKRVQESVDTVDRINKMFVG